MKTGRHLWVVGTFDTKAAELNYLAGLIREAGVPALTVDISTRSHDAVADIPATEVATYHPEGARHVLGGDDRGRSVMAMGQALCRLVTACRASDALLGMVGIGGSGGTSMIAPALHLLPYGMPKVLVSTLASGNTAPFVDVHDLVVINPVTDLAGLNRLSRRILANAAHAAAGMVLHPAPEPPSDARPALGFTMFGVTTQCVQAVTAHLENAFECQVFHANGPGGRALEALARSGMLNAVVDITTTEIGQHLAGGVCDAGPDRLAAAAEHGLPWVGSVGALDMINWGPPDTIPERHAGRLFHVHNSQVTLMRSTAEELERAGTELARRLNRSTGPVRLLLPLEGISALDAPGQVFHDPQADAALFAAIEREFTSNPDHQLIKVPLHINHPAFARLVAQTVREVIHV